MILRRFEAYIIFVDEWKTKVNTIPSVNPRMKLRNLQANRDCLKKKVPNLKI
jgi:hypothetical protein